MCVSMETKTVIWARRGFVAACAACAISAMYLSRKQFVAWHTDPSVGAYLVPPYRPIGYFMRYAFTHFWLQYVISFVAAWFFFILAKRLNARRNGMIFEKEELYFLAIGLGASGHPGWIFYLLLVFSAYLLAALIGAAAHGATARVSFYYFWLPCAAVTIILNAYLHQYAWYANLLI